MNNQEVVTILQECKQALDALSSGTSEPAEEDKKVYQRCEASLSDDLRTLLQEAKEMKWPFVPERWQYKQALCPEDKTNLKDMISAKLHELLVYLKASIVVKDCTTAAAVVFLIDRFLYWVDASSRLLQVAKGLHKLCPTTPIAPQVVIRQARVSVNSGKLLKAEYILSSLINNNGATGSWTYAKESDRVLVQSVSIQIRGQILLKLGMWYEAAELIWASIVGYFELPLPDKKGVGVNEGCLTIVFISSVDKDYDAFKNNPRVDLCLLKEFGHRLLFIACVCVCVHAVVFVGVCFAFLFTCSNIRGTCLLSYSFSSDCPPEKKKHYLSEAKEAFEVSLLTKKDNEVVTSKQELHSFVKAAFCLTAAHKGLSSEKETLQEARQMCKAAMEKLYSYGTLSETVEKRTLAEEIMALVKKVKDRLQVRPFPNSDDRSYIPDSYKVCKDRPVVHGKVQFDTVLKNYSQYHTTVCQVFESTCRNHKHEKNTGLSGACITAMKTETRILDTVCITEDCGPQNRPASFSPGNGSDKGSCELQNKTQRRIPHFNQVNTSLDEETKSSDLDLEDNKRGRSLKGSQSSCAQKSWFQVSGSGSSSSWEEIDDQGGLAIPKEKSGFDQDVIDTSCSTAFTEDAKEEGQGCAAPALPMCFQNLSVRGDVSTHSAAPHSPISLSGCLLETTEDTSDGTNNIKDHPGINKRQVSHPSRASQMSSNTSQPIPSLSSKTAVGNLSLIITESHSFEMVEVDRELETASGIKGASDVLSANCGADKNCSSGVDSKAEAADENKDIRADAFTSTDEKVPAGSANCSEEANRLSVSKEASLVSDKNMSIEMLEVDPEAETADMLEDTPGNIESRSSPFTNVRLHSQQRTEQGNGKTDGSTPVSNVDRLEELEFGNSETTEEDEGDRLLGLALNSSNSSTSSFRSWYKSPYFSSSFSEVESPSSLNSSGNSFVFVTGRSEEEIHKARIFNYEDYEKLFKGVSHSWLLERLCNTGIFKPKRLQKVYTALLLKYSKTSDKWTAQETLVHIGEYLSLNKAGKQRNAFWIQFLHQEETLGRYVGKEYKVQKELSFHFNDVERQMTAQHYVTQFNKRLYEQKVPTQIFYIPASVLLVLEDMEIKGCISVEPYMLGDFVKLTNNTKVAKEEYEATTYGLAFGHFTYEFSKYKEVVVDLQGWVTGDGKGLIYLTDPQIHSVDQSKKVGTNFGPKGINYFFNYQHVECNDICRRLSLTKSLRPKPLKN
uniref:Alpha kinase 1 n=1 Tax=Latimeria chalumnae TaxID=7897 RepID=H3A639_LATCH